MDERDLERLVDQALRRLPLPRAPRTLAPRVMAAIGAAPRPRPWYSRPWLAWPRAMQALSLCVAGLGGFGAWELWTQAPAALQQSQQALAVVRALWGVFVGPIAIVVFLITLVVVLACAAAWTAVSRVTLGGTSS